MYRSIVISLLAILSLSGESYAKQCDLGMLNPVSDVAWNGVFPIRVAGVRVSAAPDPDTPDNTSLGSVVCTCSDKNNNPFIGIKISYWNVAYLAEVVKDAYCSTTLGSSLVGNSSSTSSGTMPGKSADGQTDTKIESPRVFNQTHWLTFPAMKMIGMMLDSKCGGDSSEYAFGDMSEVNPLYMDDESANMLDPRSYLVANFAAEIAAIPSFVIAAYPNDNLSPLYDGLFWMWWMNIYPFTGGINSPHPLTTSVQLAARQVFQKTYERGVLDYTLDSKGCTGQWQPVPKKSTWRFQLAKPAVGTPIIAGRTELLWGTNKTVPYKDGNFLYVLFQKINCCQKVKGSN